MSGAPLQNNPALDLSDADLENLPTSQLLSTLIQSQQSIQNSLSRLEKDGTELARPASASRISRNTPHFMQNTESVTNRSQTPEVRRKVARVKHQRQKLVNARRRYSQSALNASAQSDVTAASAPNSRPSSVNRRSLSRSSSNANVSLNATPSLIKNLISNRERIHVDVTAKNIGQLSVLIGLGTISVPNYRLTSLEGLGVRDDLKIMYLQDNFLVSFKYLGVQPNLEFIHATNNCISSFYALQTQPKLKAIDLSGNPITKHPHYRLMCLMCAGAQLKTIDDEPVKFKEREFVKKFVARYPLAVDALRAGWLLDMKVRTDEEFSQVIQRMQSIDMDDRNVIRDSEVYQSLTSGNFRVGTESIKPHPSMVGSSLEFSGNNDHSSLIDLNMTAQSRRSSIPAAQSGRKKSTRNSSSSRKRSTKSSKSEEISSPDASTSRSGSTMPNHSHHGVAAPTLRPLSSTSSLSIPIISGMGSLSSRSNTSQDSVFTNGGAHASMNGGSQPAAPATPDQYMEEIRRLKEDLMQRNDLLQQLKEKTKEMQTNTVSIETLLYFTSLEIKGFIYTAQNPSDVKIKVVTALTKDFLHLSDLTTIEEVRTVQLIEISKTSLLMETNQLYKLHLQMHNGEDFDLVCKNRKLALALYKTLHLYIGEANRRKRLRKQQAKLQAEKITQDENQKPAQDVNAQPEQHAVAELKKLERIPVRGVDVTTPSSPVVASAASREACLDTTPVEQQPVPPVATTLVSPPKATAPVDSALRTSPKNDAAEIAPPQVVEETSTPPVADEQPTQEKINASMEQPSSARDLAPVEEKLDEASTQNEVVDSAPTSGAETAPAENTADDAAVTETTQNTPAPDEVSESIQDAPSANNDTEAQLPDESTPEQTVSSENSIAAQQEEAQTTEQIAVDENQQPVSLDNTVVPAEEQQPQEAQEVASTVAVNEEASVAQQEGSAPTEPEPTTPATSDAPPAENTEEDTAPVEQTEMVTEQPAEAQDEPASAATEGENTSTTAQPEEKIDSATTETPITHDTTQQPQQDITSDVVGHEGAPTTTEEAQNQEPEQSL